LCGLVQHRLFRFGGLVVLLFCGHLLHSFEAVYHVFPLTVTVVLGSKITWFQEHGFYQNLILSLIGLFILITLASGITTFILGKKYESVYASSPEVQAILEYIKKDIEAAKQREVIQQARAEGA